MLQESANRRVVILMGKEIQSIDVAALQAQLEVQLAGAKEKRDLEMLKQDWLSKEGIIKSLLKQLKTLDPEQRAKVAAGLNSLKERAESSIAEREELLAAAARQADLGKEYLDLSLPASFAGAGRVHPLTVVERRLAAILRPFGFSNVTGPELETEYYCFDSLNIPKHHPARDMQDTFYTDTGHVLRTHTTSVQARVLEKVGATLDGSGLPVRVASFGRVYRNETEDASHQAMFHQFDMVWVAEGLTLAHLMALTTHILKELFGRERKVRFVPKFYPYTEPSIGPQVDCVICHGKGCGACGGSGWVTVAGAGMIHRNVLREFKLDPDKVSGFAWGIGTARLAAQFCLLPKLKMLYDNDLRVLKRVA